MVAPLDMCIGDVLTDEAPCRATCLLPPTVCFSLSGIDVRGVEESDCGADREGAALNVEGARGAALRLAAPFGGCGTIGEGFTDAATDDLAENEPSFDTFSSVTPLPAPGRLADAARLEFFCREKPSCLSPSCLLATA